MIASEGYLDTVNVLYEVVVDIYALPYSSNCWQKITDDNGYKIVKLIGNTRSVQAVVSTRDRWTAGDISGVKALNEVRAVGGTLTLNPEAVETRITEMEGNTGRIFLVVDIYMGQYRVYNIENTENK